MGMTEDGREGGRERRGEGRKDVTGMGVKLVYSEGRAEVHVHEGMGAKCEVHVRTVCAPQRYVRCTALYSIYNRFPSAQLIGIIVRNCAG